MSNRFSNQYYLSYYDLAAAIRRRLLYCAIFSKDYEFNKDNLIELWISQDFLRKCKMHNIVQFLTKNDCVRTEAMGTNKNEIELLSANEKNRARE